MAINLKSQHEIDCMRTAGQLAAEVLDVVTPFVVPGVSTEELDNICFKHITEVQKLSQLMLDIEGMKKQFVPVLIKLFVMALSLIHI